MNYTVVKPIPTIFNGRKYRSRLEARWQYVFDKLGWISQYEPSEMNGRNPDFIIKCNSPAYKTKTIIVEVKPSVFISDEYCYNTITKYEDLKAHILILSDMPFEPNQDRSAIMFGQGSQYIGSKDTWRTDLTNFEMKCFDDFGSMYMAFDGMIKGEVPRKQFLDPNNTYMDWVNIKHVWIESGNKTMFLPV